MNINAYLRNISSNLVLKDEEKVHVDSSIETFKNRIKYYFKYEELFKIMEISVFGSYARNTILPRTIDEESDVDIMIVFEDDGSTPQTYLNRVRRAVEKYYSLSEIKQSSPTIVLEMKHIKFEITPAVKDNGSYYIKQNDGWQKTNALDDFDYLQLANKNSSYDLKPIIRLVKYWNVTKDKKYCSSYQLEKSLVNKFLSGTYSNYDLKTKLLAAFKCVEPLDSIDIPKAIKNIEESINDESKYPSLAESEIKRVIEEL